jgi:hypothetical protein
MKENKYTVPEGCKITSVDLKTGVVIFECEKPKFKDGEVLTWFGTPLIYNSKTPLCPHAYLTVSGHINYESEISMTNLKYGTSETKKAILNAMHKSGKDFDFENCKVVDYIWKPKEGESVWTVNERITYEDVWKECGYDNELLSKGLVFKTKELAEIASKAQIELFKTLKHY